MCMKVGIITFSNATNIGALLQAYALQEYITLNNCCEVIHLNYSYTPTAKSTLTANPMGQKLHNLFHLKAYFISKNKTNKVSSFKNTFLHLSSRAYSNSIPINAEDCSVYITGSDQVWNTELNGGSKAFYLDFVRQRKKIAYAVSVGRVLTEDDKRTIIDNCNDFDYISVRENDLNEFMVENGYHSEVACDPVFLLSKDEWRKLAATTQVPDRYVFCYVMEDSVTLRETAIRMASDNGAKIIWINGGGIKPNKFPGKELKSVGPQEFIYLIDNSVGVVTNSFHGAAFAIIFDKPLCIVKHSKRNSRLEQLASLISDGEKIISENEGNYKNKIITGSSNRLNSLIHNSKVFISDALK